MLCMYHVEVVEVVIRMFIVGRNVAGLLVPMAVIVIGHDSDPVEVPGNAGDVIADIDDLLAGGDSSREKIVPWLKCLLQLSYPV